MLDIHTHILPDFDDGSKNLSMSISMINSLLGQGVKNIVLTPHFYSDHESLNNFLDRRSSVVDQFIKDIDNQQLDVSMLIGAEVYLTKYLDNYSDISGLCISGTNYILIEFPFLPRLGDTTIDLLHSIILNHDVIPIIAHIERYPFMSSKPDDIIDKLIYMGCKIQINTSSLKTMSLKKNLLKWIKDDKIHFIGSDSHNLTSRPPVYAVAISIIRSKLGPVYVDRLLDYQKEIIN